MGLVIFILMVVIVILFDLYSRARIVRARLKAFAQIIPGASFGGFLMKYRVKGELSGVRFSVSVSAGGNRSRPVLVVSCEKNTPWNVTIMKNETQADLFLRILKTPVMCSIVKTNDVYFDSKFAIYSHNNSEVSGYFYNTGRKNAVAKIIDQGYTLVRFNRKGLSARKYDYSRERDLQTDVLRSVLDNLVILTRGF